MAHPEQQQWCRQLKARFPEYFSHRAVLDVGSLDVNGNNRYLFENCEYTGVDVGSGRNVDVVCPAHQFDAPDESFDVVVSTEALEHDRYWPQTLAAIYRLTKSGGLIFFTCAGPGRPEHGTRRASPEASPLTTGISDWGDYYRNLSAADILSVWDVEQLFDRYGIEADNGPHDLRFWGVKAAGPR